MIEDLFAYLGEIADSFGTLLSDVFTFAIKLFYDNDQITSLGMLMLISLGTGLLIWGFNFIRSLIRVRRG